MKNSSLMLFVILLLISCTKNDDETSSDNEVCEIRNEIFSPAGFEVNIIKEIDFEGKIRKFQFIDQQIGFAMGENIDGYVEVFKTTNGGQNWLNLEVGINQMPVSMVFKDQNIGIITLLGEIDCTANCLDKCVIIKTQDGGVNWETLEFEELSGFLSNPKYDDDGNLYANLYLDRSLMKSTNNGNTWETILKYSEIFPSTVFNYDLKLLDNYIFMISGTGIILITNSNGDIIKTINPGKLVIRDVVVIDENNLIVVAIEELIKTTNGGDSWETIYEGRSRIIGFDSCDKGFVLLGKSDCTEDYYQVNDLIGYTDNSGGVWKESEQTSTNLTINFSDSQKMDNGIWYFMIDNKLMEIVKE